MRNRTVRARSAIVTGAAALGLALGSVGVGWAISPGPTPIPEPTAQVSRGAATDLGGTAAANDDILRAVETDGVAEADEATETQDPSYATSITAPEDEGASEADEAKTLEGLATISADQAREAALGAVPGTVGEVELDNENGAVVYSVEITDDSGSHIDLKVDAGSGAVVRQDTDGDNEG